MLKIVLTNDDGIFAPGINVLAKKLVDTGHQVLISAPDRERSAAGHSITIIDPLRAEEVDLGITNLKAFKVTGTPADSVKLGLEKLAHFRPDVIISGINDGPNIGYDVLYSGTVSAAMEGYMMGYTSIACSLATKKGSNYKTGAKIVNSLLETVKEFNEKLLLNLNIPDLPEEEIKGISITRLGKSRYEDSFEERIDPMGNRYYWLTGFINDQDCQEETDIWAIRNNQISITPLSLNLTNYDQIELLKNKIK